MSLSSLDDQTLAATGDVHLSRRSEMQLNGFTHVYAQKKRNKTLFNMDSTHEQNFTALVKNAKTGGQQST